MRRRMPYNRIIRVCTWAMFCLALHMSVNTLSAQSQVPQILRVVKGKSIVVSFPERIKTISIANEAVVDVATITPTDAVVIGKDEGVTSLYIWGESGKYLAYEMKVDRSVTSQQIVLEVQMAEVNATNTTDFGIDWLLRDTDDRHIAEGEKILGSYSGDVTVPDPRSQNLDAQAGITGVVKWIGDKQTAQAIIRALEEKGNLKMLANPRLVCLSNEEASFLVGGEIPVPIAQQSSGGGSSAITIEWKEFGVKLRFTPTIVDTNLIRLKIAPEVSSLDYSNPISLSGWIVPAIRTRKASGTVELNSTQAIVLGGLHATEMQETVSRVPILGHIPLLGYLFTKKHKVESENELLIVVSPRIIESAGQEVVPPLPGVAPDTTK